MAGVWMIPSSIRALIAPSQGISSRKCWLKYKNLRPDRLPARPSANTYHPAWGAVHPAPTTPRAEEGGAPVGA